jgi:hypothetical protein
LQPLPFVQSFSVAEANTIQGQENYNILQVSHNHAVSPLMTEQRQACAPGTISEGETPELIKQVVDHVHFHFIPKPAEAGDKEGLVIGWPSTYFSKQTESLTYFSSRCTYPVDKALYSTTDLHSSRRRRFPRSTKRSRASFESASHN